MDPIIVLGLILTTIRKSPDNMAPEGLLYAGLMSHVTLAQFNAIVGAMVDTDCARRGPFHTLSLTAKGIEKADVLERIFQG